MAEAATGEIIIYDHVKGENMDQSAILFIVLAGAAFLLIGVLATRSGGSLNGIKAKTVGDGQHGTARWATKKELKQTYQYIPFRPVQWRKGENLPKVQGLVLGCEGKKNAVSALVDSDDIHCVRFVS